ncbi:MAG: hypothetical protein AMXMBFR84_11240 [Candidatus Hydrogenedentota bacterium]
MRVSSIVVSAAFVCANLCAQMSAPHAFIPPDSPLNVQPGPKSIADGTLQTYLNYVDAVHVITSFQGKNALLETETEPSGVHQVGRGLPLHILSADLFGEGKWDGPVYFRSAALQSADAEGMRLFLDLSTLNQGEEIYVVDPTGPRAFGPFTKSDAVEGGRWTPTIQGDTAIIIATGSTQSLPSFEILGLSHFFRPLSDTLKLLPCHNNIACDNDSMAQQVSTGIGLMVTSGGTTLDSTVCSGALINNPDTQAFEPYFLTAWHCVPDYLFPGQVDIIWDYRASGCGLDDPPGLASLPRSDGEVVLSSNASLDVTLMRLSSVPVGSLGRAYLGWVAETPSIGEAVLAIHHPNGSHMRITYGTVRGTNEFSDCFVQQIHVNYTNGTTEQGSSGSPVLLPGKDYRIVGVTSNGPDMSCTVTTYNDDWLGSVPDFALQASGFLSGTTPPQPDSVPHGYCASWNPVQPLCPAALLFKDNPGILAGLRSFRDLGLNKYAAGRVVVNGYYKVAPEMARWVATPGVARNAFTAIALPVAEWGNRMDVTGQSQAGTRSIHGTMNPTLPAQSGLEAPTKE